jgi:6-phosphogluconolactonase (cycloisomerase 2 family)
VSVGGYPEDIIISSDGQYVYTANFGSDFISALQVNSNGSLTLLGSYPTGDGPMALTIDPTRKFLYTVNRNANTVSVFSIQTNGTLVSTTTTISTGSDPYKLVFVKAQ